MGVVIAGFDLVEVAGVDILALSSFEWFWAIGRQLNDSFKEESTMIKYLEKVRVMIKKFQEVEIF